ncbi:Uncharacterized protein EbC_31860 [Erwinia billingiae Eb661]|uniref:Uncharacterized protein n=1 Tax=Erwinia billingiae (strain Eb661) TaxID=634500 RepID=D8MV60_ERWBE|nr:Uncharacterized protein EbC_31860 [Erwinia billingiae Eb661]
MKAIILTMSLSREVQSLIKKKMMPLKMIHIAHLNQAIKPD